MRFLASWILGAIWTTVVSALPRVKAPINQQRFSPPTVEESERKYVLPIFDPRPSDRADEIKRNREGYLYGASLLGNTSYFPTGVLGDPMVKQHVDLWYTDAAWVSQKVAEEYQSAVTTVSSAGGLQNLSSFNLLYDGQWQRTLPLGPALGAQTNYSQDLFFSMERLSVNPYVVKRLHPKQELPFEVDDEIVDRLAPGWNLEMLHANGRLFLADHSYQAKYPTIEGKFSPACSAYFYIHPATRDFLPLAIKTNVGSNLTYTPVDGADDWLLAKMMFNVNDLFHGQIFHLANSHAVMEAVYQAALRTLSAVHPVRAFLDRIMYQAFAIRPVGEDVLFNPGGVFDQSFALSNEAVRQFATEHYPLSAGPFQSNYFHQDLVARGLVNCTYGPALTSVPFYDDGNAIVSSLRRFTDAYLHAYYPRENLIFLDTELQNWVSEAANGAKVLDFPPSPLTSRNVLVSILTHAAFLTGVSHHALNSGTPASTSGVLPFHPAALYAPLPTTKGSTTSLMSFLPNVTDSLNQISLLIRFNRPKIEDSNSNLVHMFSSSKFLAGGCSAVAHAARLFQTDMQEISSQIQSKAFDPNGLAQGMPFVWRSLDPSKIPFFLSV
ncbi:hypothetical protein MMC11_008641 [Xylographa trunciseda]|nr:hypothetical protein [Xylographa trunciseda]